MGDTHISCLTHAARAGASGTHECTVDAVATGARPWRGSAQPRKLPRELRCAGEGQSYDVSV